MIGGQRIAGTASRWWLVAILAACMAVGYHADVRSEESLDQTAEKIVSQISPYENKFVVIALDVSGSMLTGGRLQQSLAMLTTIIEQGIHVGDSVSVYSFDVSPDLVLKETEIKKPEDRRIVIDRLPTVANNTVGSNIRWAHHEALKLLEASHRPYQICLLVSDNSHDAPAKDSKYYPQYLAYYKPGTLEYPQTPEAQDYLRLRDKASSGARYTFGVGVNVSETGEVEELPPPPAKTETPEPSEPAEPAPAGRNWWPWVIALVVLVLLASAAALAWRQKEAAEEARRRATAPMEVVIRNVSADASDTAFGGASPMTVFDGDSVVFGGGPGDDISVPGAVDRVATLHRRGAEWSLEAVGEPDSAGVFLDGEELKPGAGPTPFTLGQSVEIEIRGAGGLSRRVEFEVSPAGQETEAEEEIEELLDEEDMAPY